MRRMRKRCADSGPQACNRLVFMSVRFCTALRRMRSGNLSRFFATFARYLYFVVAVVSMPLQNN